MKLRLVVMSLVVGLAASLGPAAARAQPAALAEADSAWANGDRGRALQAYAQVLSEAPGQSHAIFRLAQLAEDRGRALRLYRQYIALEPNDPWGYMAAGDVLSRLGRTHEALAEYDRAARLAPRER